MSDSMADHSPAYDPADWLPAPIQWPTDVADAHHSTARWAARRYRTLLDQLTPAMTVDRWGRPTGVPVYGSLQFAALSARDARRELSVLDAAESWRQHVYDAPARLHQQMADDLRAAAALRADWDEEQARDWREVAHLVRSLANQPTHAELAARRIPGPVRPVRATPDWTPVAIPGRPGWWRHCQPDGAQLDLPSDQPPATPRMCA